MAKLTDIISEEAVISVHGSSNFGQMTPREVVNDGVLHAAYRYHCGYTMLCILAEHGLIRKPKPVSAYPILSKKGIEYLRALYPFSVARDIVAGRAALASLPQSSAPDRGEG